MIENSLKVTKSDRRAFMRLPIEERRRILAQQAEAMIEHYQQDLTWQDWTSFGLEALSISCPVLLQKKTRQSL